MNLAGTWVFQLDTKDIGISERWFESDLPSVECIRLPGSTTSENKGFVPTLDTEWTGSIFDRSWFHEPHLEPYRNASPPHFPFWLTPLYYYVGVAWYQREFKVSEQDAGFPLEVFLERVHWHSELWIDGQKLGQCESLSVPHRFRSEGLSKGVHRITVRVDNRIGEINPGPDAHSVSDHTQGNWNGIIGRMELRFFRGIIDRLGPLCVEADMKSKTVKVSGCLDSGVAKEASFEIRLFREYSEAPCLARRVVKVSEGVSTFAECFEFEEVTLWDESNPALYRVELADMEDPGDSAKRSEPFGFREFEARGTQFCMNGRRLFLRGNIDCCIFPLTGYPSMDKSAWIERLRVQRDFGVNHIRFHSWCPPKAAFEAADELGLYLQVEAPVWANHGSSFGDGRAIDQYVYRETERILEEYGNHPSFVMYAAGNEPYGERHVEYLQAFAKYWREKDARRLYTGASVGTEWPIVPDVDFIVHSRPRGLPWEKRPQSQFDYLEQIRGHDVPFVAHEMGQFCVFPDFDEIASYRGAYRARNLEMFRDLFLKNFPLERARAFLMASGQLQIACYKAEIEAALRTPGFAGIQLLGLNDFPGQGTALIGFLNAFYKPKPYVNADEVRSFFNELVPLAKFEKFVFTNDETLSVTPGVACFGETDLSDPEICWELKDGESIVEQGTIRNKLIPTGEYQEWEPIRCGLSSVSRATELTFALRVGAFRNQWNLWVYPSDNDNKKPFEGVILEHCDHVFDHVIAEGRDILLLGSRTIENGRDVVQYLRPAFWNTSWFQMKPPHTLGLSIQDRHPLFRDFPTRSHSDYQWWELVQGQPVANLEYFPKDIEPIVAPIDTWFLNRRLGMIFEMNVAGSRSRVMVCTMDLQSDLEHRPVARHLLACVRKYMGSADFRPRHTVDPTVLKELFERKERKKYDCMTDEKPDELIPRSAT